MGERKKILLIEDDFNVISLVKEILRDCDYECFSAYTLSSAFKKIKFIKPDLILLDLVLPTTNGYEVLEKLKNDLSMKNIPVVILSSLSSHFVEEKAIQLGAVKYLNKGFNPSELISIVNQYI